MRAQDKFGRVGESWVGLEELEELGELGEVGELGELVGFGELA